MQAQLCCHQLSQTTKTAYEFAQFDSATYSAEEAAILEFGQLYISSDTFVENCELTEFADIVFDNKESNIIKCFGGDDKVSLSAGNGSCRWWFWYR